MRFIRYPTNECGACSRLDNSSLSVGNGLFVIVSNSKIACAMMCDIGAATMEYGLCPLPEIRYTLSIDCEGMSVEWMHMMMIMMLVMTAVFYVHAQFHVCVCDRSSTREWLSALNHSWQCRD